MSASDEAPMFPRLTGAGVFRMLHVGRPRAPKTDSCPVAWHDRFAS